MSKNTLKSLAAGDNERIRTYLVEVFAENAPGPFLSNDVSPHAIHLDESRCLLRACKGEDLGEDIFGADVDEEIHHVEWRLL
jgi:hypothetical protein